MPWFYKESSEITRGEKQELMQRLMEEASKRITKNFRKVLLLPPDLTRYPSGAGELTEMFYKLLPKNCEVDVIPTLGQHVPHTEEENKWMFPSIPLKCFHPHDWRSGNKLLGEVSADYVKEVSKGKADWPIPIEINKMVVENKYDLVVNIGWVVPHEVLGFSNHNKNYFIGLGGKETICASHMMAACCGIENNLGQIITPLRACYNKAEEDFLGDLPDVYVLIVTRRNVEGRLVTTGLYVGDDLETYLLAAQRSREQNITVFDEPVKKIVTIMAADEFRSGWVANKAIYRTRMAVADGGELLIMAPGMERFGEQPEVDALIRKYGYRPTPVIMEQFRKNKDMQDLRHATAHLIHGSSEGRFTITYAPGKMSKEEIEGVGFHYADLSESLKKYNPEKMKEGWNTMPNGEKIYFISSPAAGLWSTKEKLYHRMVGT